MEMNNSPTGDSGGFSVVVAIVALLAVPATLTLRTVAQPGRLVIDSSDPTPYGYTWSLLLFLIPLAGLGLWFLRRVDLRFQRKAFWLTIGVLAPLGFVLDILFGSVFFEFKNEAATIGLRVPAVGEPIPIEEFVFYLTGFMAVLLIYIWCDEYWVAKYNIPDYEAKVGNVGRILKFHWRSVAVGAALLGAATVVKSFSEVPDGFPWYFAYLVGVSIIPSAGLFRSARDFINWRAFSVTFLWILLVSLLWEATLGVPYGWWDYHRGAMMGIFVGAWADLPLEAVCVWFAVTFTTVIFYEAIKIWRAMKKPLRAAFFG
jgi:hypothetical protein